MLGLKISSRLVSLWIYHASNLPVNQRVDDKFTSLNIINIRNRFDTQSGDANSHVPLKSPGHRTLRLSPRTETQMFASPCPSCRHASSSHAAHRAPIAYDVLLLQKLRKSIHICDALRDFFEPTLSTAVGRDKNKNLPMRPQLTLRIQAKFGLLLDCSRQRLVVRSCLT